MDMREARANAVADFLSNLEFELERRGSASEMLHDRHRGELESDSAFVRYVVEYLAGEIWFHKRPIAKEIVKLLEDLQFFGNDKNERFSNIDNRLSEIEKRLAELENTQKGLNHEFS